MQKDQSNKEKNRSEPSKHKMMEPNYYQAISQALVHP